MGWTGRWLQAVRSCGNTWLSRGQIQRKPGRWRSERKEIQKMRGSWGCGSVVEYSLAFMMPRVQSLMLPKKEEKRRKGEKSSTKWKENESSKNASTFL